MYRLKDNENVSRSQVQGTRYTFTPEIFKGELRFLCEAYLWKSFYLENKMILNIRKL